MTDIIARPYQNEADIQSITRFLLDTYLLTKRLDNWDARRWIGRVYHRNDTDKKDYIERLPQQVRIWEDSGSLIRGVVIPEYEGGVYLQIHPDYRELEIEMLQWAEANLLQHDDTGQGWLEVHAYEDDSYRTSLLKECGYVRKEGSYELIRRNDFKTDISPAPVADGYELRTIRNQASDWEGLSDLLNAAFNRTIHNPGEIRNFMQSPYYQDELNFVVESPGGSIVAHAGFTMHERESFAVVEPVCTHPQHQSKGLARSAIVAGLQYLKERNIASVYVGTGSNNDAANHVYNKLGFTVVRHLRCFRASF